MKRNIGFLIMICALMLSNSITTFAHENTLHFGIPYQEEEATAFSSDAYAIPAPNFPTPLINSDGTFSVDINNIGYKLSSDKFKVSSTSSTIKMDAGSGGAAGSEYYITLYKHGVVPTKIKTVTYYTGGIYQYTFNNLSTSDKYYMVIYSDTVKIHASGSITNYVHL